MKFQLSPFLRRWAVWLLGVFVLAVYVNAAPSLISGGCSNCVLRTGDTMTGTLSSSVASGTNAFGATVNGARIDFGAGATDYASSDGTTVTFAGSLGTSGNFTWSGSSASAGFLSATTNYTTLGPLGSISTWIYGQTAAASGRAQVVLGAINNLNNSDIIVGFSNNSVLSSFPAAVYASGYITSTTPFNIANVYVNNTINAFTYGGGTLPAHAMTVTDIAFYIRTIGSGGSTNATFQVSDGTNTCNCTFACNTAAGSKIASCANGAGTGCVYAASAALTYTFSGVGDCTFTTDIMGNIDVRGKWQ